MSLVVPAPMSEIPALHTAEKAGLRLFLGTLAVSFLFHLLLVMTGQTHLESILPPLLQKTDPPAIMAEIVPPPPQAEEAIGELRAPDSPPDALPPVDTALVNGMKAESGKKLIACRKCTLAGADFKKAYLRLASFQGSDMRQANLAGADLTGGRFSRANLEGANLSGADASGIDLRGANLKKANLSYTRLDAALLHNADLTGAILMGANLRLIEWVDNLKLRDVDARGAIFRYASLNGVDFTGANLSGADFTRAKGLTNAQLALACGDEKTKLPDGLRIPMC
ncbi:MAG: hypothetical protein GC184_04725 [Rhizobiales bacterium]|nr:hypothetical protein [Hyphomicrobiales bacterium]